MIFYENMTYNLYNVLRHHIILISFDETRYAKTTFPLHLSLFLSYHLNKTISTFKIKKIFNETSYIRL